MSLSELKIYHKTPYSAIDPGRPELNQTGKTVLITGGNGGIGFATARAFIVAGAKRVIITGRRVETVEAAAVKLNAEAKTASSSTLVDGRVSDAGSLEATEALWADLEKENITVDVLVLNAAFFGKPGPILGAGRDKIWHSYTINVMSSLDFTERLYKQKGQGAGGRKYIINVSSVAIYMWHLMDGQIPSYGLSKNAGTALLQQIAQDIGPEELQIISLHPGTIFTDAARSAGMTEDSLEWDDENLAGRTVLWSATPEAEFLHGRFTCSNWDVNEMKNGIIGQRIKENPNYLRVGVEGLSETSPML